MRGVLFLKAGTSRVNTRDDPMGGQEYYQSRNAVNEIDETITKNAAYLDGPFVDPAKRTPFRFGESDKRLAIALTNADQERLQRGREKRMPVIGPAEIGTQRATKRQRTGYGCVDHQVC